MSHEVTIEYYGKQFAARPYAIVCSCGFKGAAATKEEADKILDSHKQRWGQK